jgi:3-oxoacyl-[acyl-carrier protein] reductase
MFMTELMGKVALVTGGSRGIGAATARRLAKDGAAVALTYVKSADKAHAVAEEIEKAGGRTLVIKADNAEPGQAVDAVEQAAAELGRLDILVNNAGIVEMGPLETMTVEALERLWAVDVKSVFLASQAAARHMGEGGRIITVGSALAERAAWPGTAIYSMCKAALVGMTRGLARELGPRGITATVINAGAVDTDLNPADGPAADGLRALTPLGRYGTAEEIAEVVAQLAGAAGTYISGTAITVDGGFAA